MLKLKPNCECCGLDLAPDSSAARICTFEYTFCNDCAENNFQNNCPNCGGDLVRRPIRPSTLLHKYPASTERFINNAHAGCSNYGSRGA